MYGDKKGPYIAFSVWITLYYIPEEHYCIFWEFNLTILLFCGGIILIREIYYNNLREIYYISFQGIYDIIFERELYYFLEAPAGNGSAEVSLNLVEANNTKMRRGCLPDAPLPLYLGPIRLSLGWGFFPVIRIRLAIS